MGQVIPLVRRKDCGQVGNGGRFAALSHPETGVPPGDVDREDHGAELVSRLRSRGYRLDALVGSALLERLAALHDEQGLDAALCHLEELPGGPEFCDRGSRERTIIIETFRDALAGRSSLDRELRTECLDEARAAAISIRRQTPGSAEWRRLEIVMLARVTQATAGRCDARIIDRFLRGDDDLAISMRDMVLEAHSATIAPCASKLRLV